MGQVKDIQEFRGLSEAFFNIEQTQGREIENKTPLLDFFCPVKSSGSCCFDPSSGQQ